MSTHTVRRRMVALAALLAMLGATLLAALAVHAVPPLPFSPYGTVKVNGMNVPEGTRIGAWCGGVQYQEAETLMYEGDSVYFMNVPGNDDDTAEKDGCVAGETVSFTITTALYTLPADQEATWSSGDLELDLTGSHGFNTYLPLLTR